MQIVDRVYRVPGVMANSYLAVDDDGLTLIDAGVARSETRILRFLSGLGYAAGDLKRILITHADRDHVGGLAALKAASGAAVYASPVEAEAIAAGRLSREFALKGVRKALLALVQRFFTAAPATVDVLVADGQALPVLGGLQVLATPGHTPGHVSFFAPAAGVLFCGDSVRVVGRTLSPPRGASVWDEAMAVASLAVPTTAPACAGGGRSRWCGSCCAR